MARSPDKQPSLFPGAGPTQSSEVTEQVASIDATIVLLAWVAAQEAAGRIVQPTPRRKRVVATAMRSGPYSQSQLLDYLRWVFTSDDRWPRFMRDPSHPYLEVENLMRHLREHVPTATAWASKLTGDGPVTVTYGGRTYTG